VVSLSNYEWPFTRFGKLSTDFDKFRANGLHNRWSD